MKDLSFPGRADDINEFYSDIHRTMAESAHVLDARYPSQQDYRDFIERYKGRVDRAAPILDAGCGGTAVFSLMAAKAGFENITAIDVNEQNLRHGSELADGLGLAGNIRFERQSILKLEAADDRFALVLSGGVAHHTSDPAKAIAELCRVCRPGGYLYLSLYCFEGSAFEMLVRLWRLIGRGISMRLVRVLFGSIATINNFVLDHMYVPTIWLFRASDVRELLAGQSMELMEDYPSRLDVFQGRAFGRTISGDGLLRIFISRKPASAARDLAGEGNADE